LVLVTAWGRKMAVPVAENLTSGVVRMWLGLVTTNQKV